MGENTSNTENGRIMLKEVLKTASAETMDQLENTHPFEDDETFFLAVLAAAMPNFSPDQLAAEWGISKDAAIWILSTVVYGHVVLMGREDGSEEE